MRNLNGKTQEAPVHGASTRVYVPNVDTTFAKAVKAGGKVVEEPIKRDDPDKRGGVTDPSGIVTFWIGTQVEAPPS